jgi:superfamily II DNA or RNA helicase
MSSKRERNNEASNRCYHAKKFKESWYDYELFGVQHTQSLFADSIGYHWDRIPEEYLSDCGYLTNFNIHRKLKVENLALHKTQVKDIGVDGLLVVNQPDGTKSYELLQMKLWATPVPYGEAATFLAKLGHCRRQNQATRGIIMTVKGICHEIKEDILASQGALQHIKTPEYLLKKPPQSTADVVETLSTQLVRRDYQQDTINTVVTLLKDKHRIALSLPCGMGKTIVANETICELQPRLTLVIAPELNEVNNIFSRFTTPGEKFRFDSHGSTDKEELCETILRCHKSQTPLVVFTTHATAETKLHELLFPPSPTEVSKLLLTSILIVDEVHDVFNKSLHPQTADNLLQVVNAFKKSLLLSATIPDNLGDQVPFDIFLNKYDFAYGIKNKHIVDYRLYVPSFTFGDDNSVTLDTSVLPEECRDIVFEPCPNLNLLVSQAFTYINMLKRTGSRRGIVYLQTQEDCLNFLKIFAVIGELVHGVLTWGKRIIATTSSADRQTALQEFESGGGIVFKILTSCGCLDQAVDLVRCDSVFITSAGGNEIRTTQRICRGIRVDKLNPGKINNVLLWSDGSNLKCLEMLREHDPEFHQKVRCINRYYDTQNTVERLQEVKESTNLFYKLVTVSCLTNEEKQLNNMKKYVAMCVAKGKVRLTVFKNPKNDEEREEKRLANVYASLQNASKNKGNTVLYEGTKTYLDANIPGWHVTKKVDPVTLAAKQLDDAKKIHAMCVAKDKARLTRFKNPQNDEEREEKRLAIVFKNLQSVASKNKGRFILYAGTKTYLDTNWPGWTITRPKKPRKTVA